MPKQRPQRPEPPVMLTPSRPGTPAPNQYTPPAGFPADPNVLLLFLEAGDFTPAQATYLRSSALAQYISAINNARGLPGQEANVAMGDKIIAAWLAALAKLGPAPVINPFNP